MWESSGFKDLNQQNSMYEQDLKKKKKSDRSGCYGCYDCYYSQNSYDREFSEKWKNIVN